MEVARLRIKGAVILPHTPMEVLSPEKSCLCNPVLYVQWKTLTGVICVPWHLLEQTHPTKLVSHSRYCQFSN